MEQIIGAIIIAVSSIIAAIIGVKLKTTHYRKKIEHIQQDFAISLGKQIFERYGLKADSVTGMMEVLDMEGNTRDYTEWKGLVTQSVVFPYIPGRTWVTTPNGKISSYPELINDQITFPKELSLNHLSRNETECRYEIRIAGGLTPNDPPLDYKVESKYSKSVLMKKEEVELAYRNDDFKYDYFAIEVIVPIKELQIVVVFPEDFRVKFFPGVFYGQSELFHDGEYARIKDCLKTTSYRAQLNVKEPLVGFCYFIYWSLP